MTIPTWQWSPLYKYVLSSPAPKIIIIINSLLPTKKYNLLNNK